MDQADYYGVLNVKRNADEAEIKRSYHELAKKYHPDLNKGDKKAEEKLKKVNEAYAVLKDKDKRAEYDRSLEPLKKETPQAAPQPEKKTSAPETKEPRPHTASKFSSFQWWYFTFNKLFLLLFMLAYGYFYYVNIDPDDPYNVLKALSNMADALLEEVPILTKEAFSALADFCAELSEKYPDSGLSEKADYIREWYKNLGAEAN